MVNLLLLLDEGCATTEGLVDCSLVAIAVVGEEIRRTGCGGRRGVISAIRRERRAEIR